MCGIAGIISVQQDDVQRARLKKMTDVIAHRGPDGEGHWISDNNRVGLGHRRLSIIDLSHAADQPMQYLDRYQIVFNGEIYNYPELRDALLAKGYSFSTQSDTEVLLAMYDCYKAECLHQLDGMFSFALYDRETEELFCARDRFGEKPFFYSAVAGKYFLFGSEMKCLWAAGVEKKINERMLYNYLSYGSLENRDDLSETFYTGCTRLPHGCSLSLNVRTLKFTVNKYYDLDHRAINTEISLSAAREKFHQLFYTSVLRRLRSDVPVGSSLSGGLDSSLVVTVIDALKKGTGQRQETFSAEFPGFKKNERPYMDRVIAATNVTPHFVTPDEAGLIHNLDTLCAHQEEPFGSASIYVQYCVMKLAKENNVTVLLDGQGADEILAGYHGYYLDYFRTIQKTDRALYKKETRAYTEMHANSQINADLRGSAANRLKYALGNQLPRIKKVYHRLKYRTVPFVAAEFDAAYRNQSFSEKPVFDGLNESLYASTFQQGLQELLRYADRNSMAHSREVRLPFLYHELVEFLFALPENYKIKDGWTKWIMRSSFEAELPPAICWRKDKIGYEPPQQDWLSRGPVVDKMNDISRDLAGRGLLSGHVDLSKLDTAQSWRLLMAGEFAGK